MRTFSCLNVCSSRICLEVLLQRVFGKLDLGNHISKNYKKQKLRTSTYILTYLIVNTIITNE